MSRNVVICLDGTNNQLAPHVTNVIRLTQVLQHDTRRQITYYDPGIGILADTRHATPIGYRLAMFCGSAFGANIYAKVERAYRYLMACWEPDDKVFIFGFSRG